jgi:hypothetical protein
MLHSTLTYLLTDQSFERHDLHAQHTSTGLANRNGSYAYVPLF